MIIPKLKKIQIKQGYFDLSLPTKAEWMNYLEDLTQVVKTFLPINLNHSATQSIEIIQSAMFEKEEYAIEVSETKILIKYNEYPGLVHAFATLAQLNHVNKIECCIIQDKPSIQLRGFMLDISRDKTPSIDTIKQIIRWMSMVKMNHFELYVEGFSLALPSFPKLPYDTPITVGEYQELEHYAKIYGIDMVPNINTFGHMTKWLELDDYKHLAECPNGFERGNIYYPSSTVDPINPKSFELVNTIVNDVLSYSNSSLFNINGDEPFELGLGMSHSECERLGKGKVYIDFISKVCDIVKNEGRTPLVWGDIIAKHPEVLSEVPKDITVIDWGYDYRHNFDYRASCLHQHNIPFLLAPGTSSWNSFAYRHKDMIATTNNAVDSCIKYGGLGVLMTDWGDYGHSQTFPFTLPGLIYAASETWTKTEDYQQVESWLETNVFHENPVLASVIRQIGSYSELESRYMSNGTMTFRSWLFAGLYEKDTLEQQYNTYLLELKKVKLESNAVNDILNLTKKMNEILQPISNDYADEIRLSIKFIQMSVLINDMVNNQNDHHEECLSLINSIEKDYPVIWLKRNKYSGLDRSSYRIKKIKELLINCFK